MGAIGTRAGIGPGGTTKGSVAVRGRGNLRSIALTSRKAARRPRRLTIVFAQWCPHCVPISIKNGQRLARRLLVPFRTLDIDRRKELVLADRLVREFGDDSVDYLIPQVFLEWTDGSAEHLLTGFSEDPTRTARAWKDLLSSDSLGRVLRGVRS